MKVLLDTHTFLWAISDDPRLSRRAAQIFIGPSDVWLSVVSIWEILTKSNLGRMPLPEPTGSYLVGRLAENRIATLPFNLDHALRIENLPLHHRDPFDRMLIAQSMQEDWPIVTADPAFKKYPVQVIW
jgi:PIN domain nuclease of toxin-antitoxin system